MLTNPIIETMLNRKSVSKYTDQKPSEQVIQTIVRAGQQGRRYGAEVKRTAAKPRRTGISAEPVLMTDLEGGYNPGTSDQQVKI